MIIKEEGRRGEVLGTSIGVRGRGRGRGGRCFAELAMKTYRSSEKGKSCLIISSSPSGVWERGRGRGGEVRGEMEKKKERWGGGRRVGFKE